MTDFHLRLVGWAEAAAELAAVRRAVFIAEQGVPEELEWDDKDGHALHVLATDPGGTPIGTARLVPEGAAARIGRMAVVKPWRGRGVGGAMLALLMGEAARRGFREVFLDAQTHAVPFYERFGFRAQGEEFFDAGIPHRRMRRRLD